MQDDLMTSYNNNLLLNKGKFTSSNGILNLMVITRFFKLFGNI